MTSYRIKADKTNPRDTRADYGWCMLTHAYFCWLWDEKIRREGWTYEDGCNAWEARENAADFVQKFAEDWVAFTGENN